MDKSSLRTTFITAALLALAAASLGVLVFALYTLVRPNSSGIVRTPRPIAAFATAAASSFEPTQRPAATLETSPSHVAAQPLEAGTHATTNWQPALAFTTNEGWRVERDESSYVELSQWDNAARIFVEGNVDRSCEGMAPADDKVLKPELLNHYLVSTGDGVVVEPIQLGGLEGWRFDGLTRNQCAYSNGELRVVNRAQNLTAVLGGPESAIVVSWYGEDADRVVDSFAFELPSPQPTPTPPACLPAGAGIQFDPPDPEPGIETEAHMWTASDGTPTFAFVATNRNDAPWSDPAVKVAAFDACGAAVGETIDLGDSVERGSFVARLRTVTRFVPQRVEVVPISSPLPYYKFGDVGSCAATTWEQRDSASDLMTYGVFTSPNGDVGPYEIEAIAIYRDAFGDVIGADSASFEGSIDGEPTSVEVRHSGPVGGLISVDLYCRATRMV